MRKISLWKSLMLFTILLVGLSSCNDDPDDVAVTESEQEIGPEKQDSVETVQGTKTLTEIIVETDSLSVLEAALIKTGLDKTLSESGPFTVLAPTDDTFELLLTVLGDSISNLDDVEGAAEIDWLRNILLYHVIPSEIKAADLSEGSVETAFEGNTLQIKASGETFTIGDGTLIDAHITATDILASNGVVHTIDKTLVPREALDAIASINIKELVDEAVEGNDLQLLADALLQGDAEWVENLGEEEPFTVFAPTYDAFTALLDTLGDDYNDLSDFDTEEEKALLVKVLTYHVVAGTAVFSTDLSDGQVLETLQGENLIVSLGDGTVQIDDATETNANVAIADVKASNGVAHVIDKVLLPQEVLDVLNPPSQ